MKIRIGFGLGTRSQTHDRARFIGLVEHLEAAGVDSLWFSDRIGGEAPDPVVAMAVAAARTEKMKFGMSVMVLPGRNPAVVAKQLASLDRLSGGRLLPAFGLGARDATEHQAFGVRREERAAIFDEALPLIRRLWSGERIDHEGPHFSLSGVQVLPRPVQDPIDVWLGGIAPSELRRVGRLGDGWLPSFCTPDEVGDGIVTIRRVAAEHEREIEDEHYGALIAYAHDEVPAAMAAFVQKRRPELHPTDVIPVGLDALAERIERFVEVGASKFVVLPLVEPDDWRPEIDRLAERVLPLQN
ncbi:LLM class flavin-dependent oxidoreductase [Actinomarinicola tropica]|uniref:LLM class flavin-dependent oxidoreductase n=1 Tax=Actinomarinicola tropica TaxID=2789776 RepID=A0A5Q2RRY5_9ACTN|nr:LLM class flavin-dependent oxidoreductase [Actinomarinicola tropica]QGG95955.1 LLM class flavin-dependent oxidoreductase [Actinomarinicola tropica]